MAGEAPHLGIKYKAVAGWGEAGPAALVSSPTPGWGWRHSCCPCHLVVLKVVEFHPKSLRINMPILPKALISHYEKSGKAKFFFGGVGWGVVVLLLVVVLLFLILEPLKLLENCCCSLFLGLALLHKTTFLGWQEPEIKISNYLTLSLKCSLTGSLLCTLKLYLYSTM